MLHHESLKINPLIFLDLLFFFVSLGGLIKRHDPGRFIFSLSSICNTYPLIFFICFSLFCLRWIVEEAVRGRLCLCVIRYILLLLHRYFYLINRRICFDMFRLFFVFRWFDQEASHMFLRQRAYDASYR